MFKVSFSRRKFMEVVLRLQTKTVVSEGNLMYKIHTVRKSFTLKPVSMMCRQTDLLLFQLSLSRINHSVRPSVYPCPSPAHSGGNPGHSQTRRDRVLSALTLTDSLQCGGVVCFHFLIYEEQNTSASSEQNVFFSFPF
ncbi:hypothetical protein AMECASPLE_035880 [Ameca splendens]|uniref:Uncharacterized protein n=1 Tax=Ameca splendens TaxID=208324 RepID=A0ABV0ZUH9_9TELE